jgi:hypothetical protein
LRYKQHLNNFLLHVIIIKHCVGKKCKEKLGGPLIGSYKCTITPYLPLVWNNFLRNS